MLPWYVLQYFQCLEWRIWVRWAWSCTFEEKAGFANDWEGPLTWKCLTWEDACWELERMWYRDDEEALEPWLPVHSIIQKWGCMMFQPSKMPLGAWACCYSLSTSALPPTARFLNSSTLTFWTGHSLFVGGHPAHLRMFSAPLASTALTINAIARHWQMLPATESSLVENHWSTERKHERCWSHKTALRMEWNNAQKDLGWWVTYTQKTLTEMSSYCY